MYGFFFFFFVVVILIHLDHYRISYRKKEEAINGSVNPTWLNKIFKIKKKIECDFN
jgi:hypothetical protein